MLMSQSGQLTLQRCAAADADESRETSVDGIVIMHPDGMAEVLEIPQCLSTVHSLRRDTPP
jgi:hypothetical protein